MYEIFDKIHETFDEYHETYDKSNLTFDKCFEASDIMGWTIFE